MSVFISRVRKIHKAIYGFSSDLVQGRNVTKNSKIKIGGQERYTKELAFKFLRYSLLLTLKNQEFLETKRFENALNHAI